MRIQGMCGTEDGEIFSLCGTHSETERRAVKAEEERDVLRDRLQNQLEYIEALESTILRLVVGD